MLLIECVKTIIKMNHTLKNKVIKSLLDLLKEQLNRMSPMFHSQAVHDLYEETNKVKFFIKILFIVLLLVVRRWWRRWMDLQDPD